MAYVIFHTDEFEIERRELSGPLVVGRAQESDVAIRDILLSRKHCRIEPAGEGWAVTDLGSKNGTYLGNRPIARHQLGEGDEIRLGRTRMTFRAGPFEPAPAGTRRRDVVRPADPTEALSGTVAGFILVEPGEVDRQPGAPVPQPRPPEPSAYASEDVYGMLNEIVSSSWDSIMAQASLPVVMERPLPRPHAYQRAPRVVSRPRVAFCLQAPAESAPAESARGESTGAQSARAESEAGLCDGEVSAAAAVTTGESLPRRAASYAVRWRGAFNRVSRMRHHVVLAMLTAGITTLLVGAWVMAVNQAPRGGGLRGMAPREPSMRAHVRPELADITFPD